MTSPNPPHEPPDLKEIERALAENREREEQLLRQREQLILEDPGQRKERRRSRYILIGRWRSARGLTTDDVIELTKFDPGLAWLLGRDVLLADGWKEDPANKRWRPPVSDRSSRDG